MILTAGVRSQMFDRRAAGSKCDMWKGQEKCRVSQDWNAVKGACNTTIQLYNYTTIHSTCFSVLIHTTGPSK